VIDALATLLDLEGLRRRVHEQLTDFLLSRLSATEPGSVDRFLVQATTDLVLGPGKRLRAAFCYWGWRGAGGPDGDAIVAAAAALELLHGMALVHDDVMDGSALRRGAPSVHERFAERHTTAGWRGSPDGFGTAAAILAGDLCGVWADMMLRDCGLSPVRLRRAGAVYDAMREQTIRGQYLDLVTQAQRAQRMNDAWRVAGAKTAANTTIGPLTFGAALAGSDPLLRRAYEAYAEPLGLAFQLRDDLLGAFGEPELTGKPSGDDLRDGKCTLLVARARLVGGPRIGRRIDELSAAGSPDAVAELRGILDRTGARDYVQNLIGVLGSRAVAALDGAPVVVDARRVLVALAQAVTSAAPIPGIANDRAIEDRGEPNRGDLRAPG
jgi:geranylgeranyl diphosphate synthase type I